MSVTFGIAMVRDEADVIEGVLRHMAAEVDELIVADNGSVDGTRDILASLSGDLPLTVLDDPDPAYRQSQKVSALAERAADAGADWVLPFDADEIWVAAGDRISVVLAGLDCQVAVADLVNHFCTSVDLDDPDPFRSMVWRQSEPARLPKVAFRYQPRAVVHQGNHGVTLPYGGVRREGVLQVRHFPYRSAEQMVRKARNGAAAYRAAPDLPADQGAHWRAYGEIIDRHGPGALEDVFREHFWYLSPTDSGLIRDPAPYRRWLQDEGAPGV